MPQDATPNGDADGSGWKGPGMTVAEMQAKLHRWAAAAPGRRFDDLFNLPAPRKRSVISPVKPGETRRKVSGSDG
jgi:hypothetical protein